VLGSRDVAIVGMACIMPGAPDVESFWANVVDGVDSVTEVPSSRWVHDTHFDPSFDSSRRKPGDEPMSVSKWGGFVPDVGFDALAWGIPPASLASIDMAQLMALRAAAGALEDAGMGPDGPRAAFDRERASVVYATGSGGASDLPAGFLLRLLLRNHGIWARDLPADLDAYLPELTEDGLPGVLTSVIAGRVANRLDLGGKNLTVDSACASVLVALDIACSDLLGGSSDVVVCGGVDLHNGAQDYVSFTAAGALSPTGRCRSFDAGADGMTLAEGCGCLVLKRLADAERDGDRIYAVVKGVAGSSDGRHLGLTAPRQEGQERAVRRAYAAAELSPAEIGLVEAHGTGTSAGDRTELLTTTNVFTEAGAAPGSIVMGSVKSNIGHTKCASAVASLIKAAKATYHGVLPPTLHIDRPNEVWDPETSPFVFLDRARPWLDDRRRAGVSSFGFGGTNFHAILENHRPGAPSLPPHPAAASPPAAPGTAAAGVVPRSGRPHWPAELVLLRGSAGAVAARLDALAARLEEELAPPVQTDRWCLRDIAAAVSGRSAGPGADDVAGDGGPGDPDAGAGPTGGAPVQLAIVASDLADLATKVAAARAGTAAAGVYRAGSHGAPADGDDGDGDGRRLGVGGAAEPGGDDEPDGAHGRPGPPEVAFLAPGVGSVRPGMVADVLVAFPELRDEVLLPDGIGGSAVGPMLPSQAFGDDDRARRQAALDRVAPAARTLAQRALAGALRRFGVVHHHVVAADDDDAGIAAEVRRLADAGVTVFVAVGPGTALTDLVRRTLGDRPHVAVATDRPGEHGVTTLLHALARLAVAGVPVDGAAVHADRGARPGRWADPPRRPGWIINGHFARTAGGASLPKGLRPATEAPGFHIAGGPPPAGPGAAGNGNGHGHGVAAAGDGHGVDHVSAGGGLSAEQTAVILEYLRIVQGVIATGSRIIQGHAEAQAPVQAPAAPQVPAGQDR
jgi:acyl transferase domain-containing protein